MVYKCTVPRCNGNYNKDNKVSTFGFPKDENLRRLWLSAIPRDFKLTVHSRVCERHFTEDQLLRTAEAHDNKTGVTISVKLDKIRLQKDAVPSRFPKCPPLIIVNCEKGLECEKRASAPLYKCFVVGCSSNSRRNPNKIFLNVPHEPKLRRLWMEAAGRQNDSSSPISFFRCCEDHFDVENDFENWLWYKLVGGRLRMKKGVLPHIFTSRTPEHRNCSPSPTPSPECRREDVPFLSDIDADNEVQEEDPLGDFPASVKEELSPVSFASSPSRQYIDDEVQEEHPLGDGPASIMEELPVSAASSPSVQCIGICSLEPQVKVEAPEPDPLAAPHTGGPEDQTPAIVEATLVPSRTEDLDDSVKLELTDEESQETSHSHLVPAATQPTVPSRRKKGRGDVAVYSGGCGGGFAVCTRSADPPHGAGPDAPHPTPQLVVQTVKKDVPTTAKRKTNAALSRKAKVKKGDLI